MPVMNVGVSVAPKEARPAVASDAPPAVIARADLDGLLDVLRRRGYRVVGPTVRDGAIVYDEIDAAAALPAGWTDEQGPGTYRLRPREDPAVFGYAVGPHSWKKYLFPPAERLFSVRRDGAALHFLTPTEPAPALALLGVRPCEVHAIAIQDRVFAGGPHHDPGYQARRGRLFIVAVQCGDPAATCFCASMNTGPRAGAGFDLALTELVHDGEHRFVVEVGTPAGAAVLAEVRHRVAHEAERAAAEDVTRRAAERQTRRVDTRDIQAVLSGQPDHPRWDDLARRCLSCASCTLACPTCFCSTVEDRSDVGGAHAERWRTWDSCFTVDYSYVFGGAMRPSARARYRQWLTHKLSTWIDQFGTSGCVGCGRCITWCPVGIDLTEEVRQLRGVAGAAAAPAAQGETP